jgi:DNA helicase-2/ATP-dependent DNA helicase PcrA
VTYFLTSSEFIPVQESDHRLVNVRAVERYEAKCERLRIWDFEGIVLATVRLLRDYPQVAAVVKAKFPVVMIDEYQDLGAALHRLVESLLAAGVEITAVGDVDQSIYGFAGGDPQYLDALCGREDFSVCRLVTNYRCGSAVVAAAELTLLEARGWQADPDRADPGILEFQVVDGDARVQSRRAVEAVHDLLAAGVAPHEVAVLVRYRHPLAPLVERELTTAGVPVRLEGTSTAPSTELGKWLEAAALYTVRMTPGADAQAPPSLGADALLDRLEGLERLAGRSRSSTPRITRVAALHTTVIGEAPSATIPVREWSHRVVRELGLSALAAGVGDPRTVGELDALADVPEDVLLTDLASDTAGTGKVVIATYHGAKGRTFTAVVLPGLTEGVVPPWGHHYGTPVPLQGAKLEEERRGFYVAVTRSRGSVLLQLSSSGVDTRKRPISRGYSSLALQLSAALGRTI